jgi:hypothetical protein
MSKETGGWLKNAIDQEEDESRVECSSCGSSFAFSLLERKTVNKRTEWWCSDCIKKEKERKKRARERKKREREQKRLEEEKKLDAENSRGSTVASMDIMATIMDQLSFIKDRLPAGPNVIESAIKSGIKEIMQVELGGATITPRNPCIEGIFLKFIHKQQLKPYEFDVWKHEWNTKTRRLFFNLWFEDFVLKSPDGWYVVNYDVVTYEMFVELLGKWEKYAGFNRELYESNKEQTRSYFRKSRKGPPRYFSSERKASKSFLLKNYGSDSMAIKLRALKKIVLT